MGDTKFRQTGRRTAKGPYRSDLRREKHVEGLLRNAAWDALSQGEKLLALDRRLGKGVGAVRQRKLLGCGHWNDDPLCPTRGV